MSTAGSRVEALLTYHMGQRLGTEWIEKKIGFKRLTRVGDVIQRWRFGSIVISTLAPPPFPTAWFFWLPALFRFPKNSFPGLFFWAGRCAMLLLPSLLLRRSRPPCGCLRGVRMKAS
jgi:hypothetical protein